MTSDFSDEEEDAGPRLINLNKMSPKVPSESNVSIPLEQLQIKSESNFNDDSQV